MPAKFFRLFPGCLPAAILSLAGVPGVAAAPLRDLSTDRPDTTESPRTVDKGHFQFELEIANYERSGAERSLNLGELNAKIGLTDSTDLQLVLPLYSRVRGGSEGFGEVEIRVKQNLWGNDEGSTAFGVMPFIKLPTASSNLGNGEVEGGLITALGFDLPGGWGAGVMAEIDVAADDSGDGFHAVFVNSVTTGHSLTENTSFFVELVSVASAESGADWEAWFNTGLIWVLSNQWQWDAGVRLGLTSAATDFTPFLGVSVRF